MKRIVLCCLFLVAFVASVPAQVKFGLQGDMTNLNVGNEQLSDIYGFGYGGGLHLDFDLKVISFRVSGDYIRVSPDQSKFQTVLAKYLGGASMDFTVDGGRIDVYTATANLKFGILPLPVFHIYLTGGGGVARLSATDATVKYRGQAVTNVPGLDAETKATLNAGAGVDINLGALSLFGELKVTWILTEGKTSTEVPLFTAGITF